MKLAKHAKLSNDPALMISISVISLLLFLFIIYPLIRIVIMSASGEERLTTSIFRDFISTARRPLANSIALGLSVASLSTIIGFVFAYGIARVSLPFKSFLKTIALFPIIAPPFMMALSLMLLFGQQGLISQAILHNLIKFNIYGFGGLLVVEVLTYFSTAYLTLSGVLQAIDPALEDAALDLGASHGKVFRSVTLPLATPGIASAFLLVFAQSLADFGNPMILAGNFRVLSVEAYLRITGLYDMRGGSTLALILLLPALIAFLLQKYWVSKKSFITVTGKPSSGRITNESRVIRVAMFVSCFILAAIVLLFYGMVIYGSFVKLWGVNNVFTLGNYALVFKEGSKYLKDTLILSAIATPIGGLLSMVIAFLVVRKAFPGKAAIEFISLLPFAIPGTVTGIGYILAFNNPPLILTGTGIIIILVFIFRNIAMGVQTGTAELKQIDSSIEEASMDLGADSSTTFRKITLPLIAPAFFSSLAFTFVNCMTTISAVIFLVSGKWNLVTIAILGAIGNSDLSKGAAYSVVLVAFILLFLRLIQFLVDRIGQGRKITFG